MATRENRATGEIWQWSAVETAAAIRERRVSATEVMQATLARMAAVNPQLNAIVVDLGGHALAEALAADTALAAGEEVGPLQGVPVTIKINVDVEGQANSNGVPGLANLIAPSDSPVTANLRKAGGIVFGMTNTPEFSLRGFTDNPLHGQTYNPWDAGLTCGGSSGGAGAAAAAGIGPIHHGNDIGGSLRWPAFCCGVSTIKPTLGRVPAYSESAPAERPPMAQLMSVQGPICRTVADVRLALEVMAQRDIRDPWWVPAPLVGPPVARRVARARIPADMQTDPQVVALIDRAAGWLADAGYEVDEVEVPDITDTFKLWVNLISTEITMVQLEQMEALGSEPFVGALKGILDIGAILDEPGYIRGVAYRARLLRRWMQFLEDWPVVLAPVSVQPVPPLHADLQGLAAVRQLFWNDLRFNAAVSVLGLPVATTPVGFANGAPIGVQLIGSRYREDVCLDAAQVLEERLGLLTPQLWAREA